MVLQQRLRGKRAERDDHLRRDRVDLPEQERLAGLDFVRLGIAIAGGRHLITLAM